LKEFSEFLKEFSEIGKLKNIIANLAYDIIGENQMYNLVELESVTSTDRQKLLQALCHSYLDFNLAYAKLNLKINFFTFQQE